MDFQRGERVTLDFETGTVHKLESEAHIEPPTPALAAFVGDILERDSSPANPPVAPSLKANVNGFPAHKKRIPRTSLFKQQQTAKEHQGGAPSTLPPISKPPSGAQAQPALAGRTAGQTNADMERKAIDEENRRRIAAMSDAEIEQERQELFQNFSPRLLQKLLMRSNIDAGSNEREFPSEPAVFADLGKDDGIHTESAQQPSISKKVAFVEPEPLETPATRESPAEDGVAEKGPPGAEVAELMRDAIHFPTPPQPPELDPNDPDFLKNLHEKYFPTLPYNPSELSWMAPIDPDDKSSPYHPSQTALNATELRFDFKGALLAPSIARQIPSDRGLHHHADAPEAAGYTIPELAVLSRSQVPAQRCMAYQTLGRILYRLGKGEFGIEKASQDTDGPVRVAKNPELAEDDEEEGEDASSIMAAGLWACIEEGRVIETMTEEANKTRGHLTARTFAQEALWNWRRGGGRMRPAV